jgi:hypothetical protein
LPVQQTVYKKQELLRLTSIDGEVLVSLSVEQAKLILANQKYIESFVKQNNYYSLQRLNNND